MEQIERDEGPPPDRGLRSRRGSASDLESEPRYVPSDQRFGLAENASRGGEDEGSSGRGSRGVEANGGVLSWQEVAAGGRKAGEMTEDGRGEGTSLPPIGGRRREGKEER